MNAGAIIDAVARTLWVSHWMSEIENDPERELPGNGVDYMEVAPETPPEAYIDAGRLVGMVEDRNGLQIDAAWARALSRDGQDWEALDEDETEESKQHFGHCLAMEGIGSGVSWMDDHEDWGLEVPGIEPGYMPEV